MRLITQQVRRSVIGLRSACAAMLLPAALFVVSPAALAQSIDEAPAAQFARDSAPLALASVSRTAPDVVPATSAALVPATLETNAQTNTPTNVPTAASTPDTDTTNAAEDNAAPTASLHAAADPVASGDDVSFAGAGPLDDQTLARQRGGAVGMVMVAATPQLMRGNNSVTLWDEIAPPAPLPIPVDATQNAQGNVASYTRK
ncbi:hypothetical protein VSR34_09360 [Paraburkholderia sp. JHI2823]|uniref:hypothetical protein n=1 Tax=Paraburkholderia TaxID=1822464 RepID=UPI0004128C1B|nr:hypothetical protein [Paraburkholderia mimosarum]